MPEYHPDLDPFAHRDAEPDEQPDAPSITIRPGDTIFAWVDTNDDTLTDLIVARPDDDGPGVRIALRYSPYGPFDAYLVTAVEPATGRAPAGSDDDLGVPQPAGRDGGVPDPSGRSAAVPGPVGKLRRPGLPDRGALPDAESERNWDAGIHIYRHSDRGIYDGEPDGPHPCPFCDRTDSHEHPIAVKLNPVGDA